MSDYDMFRTTLMGGFDKDDVIRQFQELKENQYKEKTRLEKELKDRDEKLAELSKRLKLKEVQRERLEKEISEKYQKYIDNYDSISGLVFDAKVQANQMLEEAIKKRDEILKEADQEANQRLDEAEESSRHQIEEAEREANRRVQEAQREADRILTEGRVKYNALQQQMNEVVDLFGQAQKRFMAAYKEVHQIISNKSDGGQVPEETEWDTPAVKETPGMSDDLTDAEIEKMFELDEE
ncbi:MAG TPA: hypothetical protein DF613_00365 [Lachnospiraceae bacterium]|nr:hypothetical protein [Lachnospiraceae bacterium]